MCLSFLSSDMELTINISPEEETGLTRLYAPVLSGVAHGGDLMVKRNSQKDWGGSEGR